MATGSSPGQSLIQDRRAPVRDHRTAAFDQSLWLRPLLPAPPLFPKSGFLNAALFRNRISSVCSRGARRKTGNPDSFNDSASYQNLSVAPRVRAWLHPIASILLLGNSVGRIPVSGATAWRRAATRRAGG